MKYLFLFLFFLSFQGFAKISEKEKIYQRTSIAYKVYIEQAENIGVYSLPSPKELYLNCKRDYKQHIQNCSEKSFIIQYPQACLNDYTFCLGKGPFVKCAKGVEIPYRSYVKSCKAFLKAWKKSNKSKANNQKQTLE